MEVLTFHQSNKELIGVAWAQFTLLVQSGPDLSLLEHLLFQHLYTGLDKESAHHLDLTSGGSFAHLTPTKGREVLNTILDRTFFVCIHEPTPDEPDKDRIGTPEPSHEHKHEIPKEEDPLPPQFLRSIEDGLFKDFGNT